MEEGEEQQEEQEAQEARYQDLSPTLTSRPVEEQEFQDGKEEAGGMMTSLQGRCSSSSRGRRAGGGRISTRTRPEIGTPTMRVRRGGRTRGGQEGGERRGGGGDGTTTATTGPAGEGGGIAEEEGVMELGSRMRGGEGEGERSSGGGEGEAGGAGPAQGTTLPWGVVEGIAGGTVLLAGEEQNEQEK